MSECVIDLTKRICECPDGLSSWWWLSYCDMRKPEGSRFVGGCYVRGCCDTEACRTAVRLDLRKPTADEQIMAVRVPTHVRVRDGERWLTTREEIGAAVGDVAEDCRTLREWENE